MAGKPQVTLTFAGDSTKLESAFSKVGTSARQMDTDVGKASKSTGKSFSDVGDSTDDVASKSGTAAGAFGALASGVELSRMRAVRHAEALKNEADKLQGVADGVKAEADEVKKAEQAKVDAVKKRVDARLQALTKQAEADGKVSKEERAAIDRAKEAGQVEVTQAQAGAAAHVAAAEQKAAAAQEAADAQKKQAEAAMAAATEDNKLTTALMVGALATDAFSGAADFATLALKSNIVQKVRDVAVSGAHKVATFASIVATNAMTVAQKALNLAMRMNPIGLVITAILLLVAGIIYAYKNSETFRKIVDKAMAGIRTAFGWVIDKGKELVGQVSSAFTAVTTAGGKMLGWFQALPGKIGGFFKGLGGAISRPFTSAFQAIKDFWNNTVGGKGFSVPDWIPGIGGKEFRIPYFHQGGIVGGAPGTETLAMLQAGERVTPANQSAAGGTLVIKSDGSKMANLLIEVLKNAIRVQGGDVQVVLGS